MQRYARGPDGKTRGFYPGWRQERKLLRSVRANAALEAQQPPRVRTFPLPPRPPAHADLDLVQSHTTRGRATPPVSAAVHDDDTGETFLLNDCVAVSTAASAASATEHAPPQHQLPTQLSTAELTAQLRAMCLSHGSDFAVASARAVPPSAHAAAAGELALQPPPVSATGWLPMRTSAAAGMVPHQHMHGGGGPWNRPPPSVAGDTAQARGSCAQPPSAGKLHADMRASFAPPGLSMPLSAQLPAAGVSVGDVNDFGSAHLKNLLGIGRR